MAPEGFDGDFSPSGAVAVGEPIAVVSVTEGLRPADADVSEFHFYV